MVRTALDLVAALADAPESDYVRIVADWLTRGTVTSVDPGLTGTAVIDALVAAAVAHLARRGDIPVPGWTSAPTRVLRSFWHPGSDRFFAWSLAHAPAEFAIRGVLIEQDSLVSV